MKRVVLTQNLDEKSYVRRDYQMDLSRLKRTFSVRVLRSPDIRDVTHEKVEDSVIVSDYIRENELGESSKIEKGKSYKLLDIKVDWPEHIRKPKVGLTVDRNSRPHWVKYEYFLKKNEISYEIFEHRTSDWLEKAKRYDLIIWSLDVGPWEHEEIKRKITIIENNLGIKSFPSLPEIMLYDNKLMEVELLQLYKLPVAETFISHSYKEIMETIPKLAYPLVSKMSNGSTSEEVFLVENPKTATKIAKSSFSRYGRKTHWPCYRQKDYVYFQKFIEGEKYDLRIIVSANMITGYFRDCPEGDFRASGAHKTRKVDIPIEAIDIALKVFYEISNSSIAIDMIKSTKGEYKIIELSQFTWSRTPVRMAVNGYPGFYFLHKDGRLEFMQGFYWNEEEILKAYFEMNYLSDPKSWKEQYILPVIEKGKLRKDHNAIEEERY